MKFDYVIGNPPYEDTSAGPNKKLWKDITKKMSNLFRDELIFITPKTQVQYLRKQYPKTTKFIDYSADDYFDVGVKIISWGISKEPTSLSIISDVREEFSNPTHYQWHEPKNRELYEYFETMKQTPLEDRMFLRQYPGSGSLELIKNKSKGTTEFCDEYVIPDERLMMVISTSKTLKEEHIIITKEHYSSLYVQLDITDYSKIEIQNIKDHLLSEKFQKICNDFRNLYGTGFNNVLIYHPKFEL